jgi:hypothetical protein
MLREILVDGDKLTARCDASAEEFSEQVIDPCRARFRVRDVHERGHFRIAEEPGAPAGGEVEGAVRQAGHGSFSVVWTDAG